MTFTNERVNNSHVLIIYGARSMKTIAYIRVSTDKQDLGNQKLEIQRYAKRQNLEIDEFIEIEISSRKNGHDRRIDELLSKLKRNDILIVSEISRLARSIRQISQIIHDLAKKKIESHFIKEGLVTKGKGDLTTKITINAFSVAAEIERDLISQRTKNGLALAKKRGVKLGNPNIHKMAANRKIKADKYAQKMRTIVTGLVDQGLTQRQIMDELNKAEIPTRRGNEWVLRAVQLLLERLNLKTRHTK